MVSDTPEEEVVICRACLSECVEHKSLHKQGIFMGEVRTLASMLGFIANMEFSNEEVEGYPTNICTRCVQNVAKTFAFKKMVLETDEVLRRQFTELVCDVGLSGSGGGGESVIEDIETESADSVVEEHHLDADEGTEVDDVDQLHELATAAQFKRSVDSMEYVALTVLESFVDGDEATISEAHSQNTINHDEQNCEEEEVVVHEVTESEDVYQTDVEEEGRDKEYDEMYEVKLEEITQGEFTLSDIAEDQEMNTNLKRPRMVTVKSDDQDGDWDGSGDLKLKQPTKIRKKNSQPKPPNPDLQCKVCGKQLSNQNSFKYHMQLHSDATPYLCSLCGEGFKTRNAYEGHIVIHDPNNPNTCELCGKSYRQSSSLRTHMLSHTGERPFQCDICGKSMTQKSGYKKHMLVHTGEKPHACDVCGREFRYSSNLIAHKRCHSGERPYECPHCKRGFPTSEQMKRHTMVHTGERPFQCEICSKCFKRRSSLISHRHTHDSEPELIVDHKVCKSNVVELY
ncbi:zinc finger and SCAN domain-containing protein 2 [Anastrepha obliqua]|uniref:zinc finger and SCAN domain-containing protein 2 n=1 Tax=Anastrepha obliqua TaxID=95512 RepID=UPI00240A5D4E|nr:zinc finger and SCAN domain-containing protein 2 [Anastrepha obliqua]